MPTEDMGQELLVRKDDGEPGMKVVISSAFKHHPFCSAYVSSSPPEASAASITLQSPSKQTIVGDCSSRAKSLGENPEQGWVEVVVDDNYDKIVSEEMIRVGLQQQVRIDSRKNSQDARNGYEMQMELFDLLKDPSSSLYKRNSFDGKRILDGWLISPTSAEKSFLTFLSFQQEFEAQLSPSVGLKGEQKRENRIQEREKERAAELYRGEEQKMERHAGRALEEASMRPVVSHQREASWEGFSSLKVSDERSDRPTSSPSSNLKRSLLERNYNFLDARAQAEYEIRQNRLVEADLNDARSRISFLERELETSLAGNSRLEHRLRDMEEELLKMKTENARLKVANEFKEKELDMIQKKQSEESINHKTMIKLQLKDVAARAQKQIVELGTLVHSLKTQLNQSQSDQRDAQERLQGAQEELKKLRSEKQLDHATIGDLRTSPRDRKLQGSEETLRMRSQTFEEKLEHLEASLQSAVEREEELRKYNEEDAASRQRQGEQLALKEEQQKEQERVKELEADILVVTTREKEIMQQLHKNKEAEHIEELEDKVESLIASKREIAQSLQKEQERAVRLDANLHDQLAKHQVLENEMKHEKEASRLSTMRIKELTAAMEALQRELHQKDVDLNMLKEALDQTDRRQADLEERVKTERERVVGKVETVEIRGEMLRARG
ncbi:hypothetical protein GUITHDRAFT_138738 [Guillardia theta CCMP2712]|uniref:Uncharacterized protein n=1 Tax=Guillardia theta (strain CCMP2712) TaxID=905079 RepID=L1JBK2_GUITC|nr:hypothetical protein GUITHDRAFT_138738 [Guillardia theta CCMP2712]EKX45913.1 hypothetical protein GUITHDRAFT_138738 [Guillardia theta CCMP2712]|eukprot:XP_005832893.1 hypothetical protein GUITHDRAFT_138738 [Guillardia theta CCMP2712]